MSARWWTGGVWALAAASGLYWGLQLFVKPQPAPAYTQTAAVTPVLRGDLSRLLGNDPPLPPPQAGQVEPAADARFQLIGVVSPPARQAAREGVALIAVDGKPAKAFRVGAVVEGDNVLQSVAARGVTLGPRDGPALVALTLPPPAAAATGTLPNMGGEFAPPARVNPAVPGMAGTPGAPGVRPGVIPPRAVQPAPGRQPGQPMPAPVGQDTGEVINQADSLPTR